MMRKYYMSDGDIQLSPHFMLHEFQSQNGCDYVLVDDELIDMLETIYEHFNCSSATVNDGFREPGEYCKSIGGSTRDAHAYGMAADMVFYDSEGDIISGKHICCYAQDIGVQGIGYMGNAVHLDTRANGGYTNTHWWGDETRNYLNVSDWHSYFNIYFEEETLNDTDIDTISDAENIGNEVDDVTITETSDFVGCCSIEYLGRRIDPEGLATFGMGLLDGTMTEKDVENAFINSDEYKKNYIKKCYDMLTGRPASDSDVEFWFASPRLRDIYSGIVHSDEAKNYLGITE